MKMRRTKLSGAAVETAIGYAADERGRGVAYARVGSPAGEQLLRVPFRVVRTPSLTGREVGYAALTAVAQALHGWGVLRVKFALDDVRLIEDVTDRRDVPAPIVLPYVRLRCALNQLDGFSLELVDEGDLTQRARAEVALNIAA